MSNGENGSKSVLVVGGGIAGMQASLDLANMGFKVYLVEKSPSIGGRMAQLDKTFPTNDCAMCILAPKMIESNSHANIELLTYSEVEKVSGGIGKFKVKVKKKASFIDWSKCTGCNECAKVCPVELNSEFNENMGKRKAIYIPFPQAIPNKYTIDKRGYPPCRFACPAGVNAQGYVALISQGKFKEALEVVRRTMPFAGVLGRVCTHPCELDCERGKFDESISIRALKRFVADYEMKAGREKLKPIKKTKKEKVAVVGSGPAGLACAYDLIKEGYAVTVFEALAEAGGLLRYGIPEYRLPKDVVDNDISYIQELGVEIKTNSPVKDFGEVFNQGYSAIFVGTGAQASQKMGIPGEESKGVIHALDFLRMVNSGVEMKLGSGVAVIGGGNAAIDAARASLRLGAKEVTVVYRRSQAEMPAIKTEIEEAEQEGIKFHFLAAPVKILSKNGQLSALECIKMELGEPDASGRRRPVPVKGSEFTMDVDNSIIAIGQSVDKAMLPKDIGYTGWGTLEVDPVTLQTNLDGVFAGGDVVNVVSGPADVVAAVAAGKEAAISIDRYLRGVSLTEERKITPKKVENVS
jgi:heterodisulfide reductase subunit A